MSEAWIVGAVRTPIGRHGGAISTVRPDDLGAIALGALMESTGILPSEVEDVYFGCANQAGEDNRNVARMSLLLAGYPETVAGATVNRLCGSGLEAVAQAARSIMLGEADVYVGGGVESMSRAPWAVPKPERAFPTGNATMYDTTLGWRFVNPRMEEMGHTDSLGITAENLAQERFDVTPDEDAPDEMAEAYDVSREAQDRFALRSHEKAAAVMVVSREYAEAHGLEPMARIRSMATAGVPPRVMGIGPVPATEKALERAGISLDDVGLVEINEAFAAQVLACLHEWGMDPEDERLNANGGAISLGHPLGASGARILTTLVHEMSRRPDVRFGLATMCIGVGQGIAMVVEKMA